MLFIAKYDSYKKDYDGLHFFISTVNISLEQCIHGIAK